MAHLKTYAVLTVLLMGLVFLGIGCTDNEAGEEGAPSEEAPAGEAQGISIKGSDTVLPLAQYEAEQFMIEYPDKSVTVTGGGSGVGIAAMIDGEVDIATASREMKGSEFENAEANGITPLEHVVAFDGISVVVNPENPVSELTFDQMRGIYNGSISNWNEVGGEDKEIAVMSRDSSSGTYEYFKEAVLLEDEYRPDALTQPTTGAIVSEVSMNPNAIGYIGVAYLDDSVKAVSVDAGEGFVYPNPEDIISGDYPLSRPLYFYTDGEPEGLTKEFVDFVMSEEGQNLVIEVGYFPVQ
ncbi:Phosphate ABC transporter, periplasmic phosphate-binding protein PstS [Methanosarcina sp. MTP4]|uniref:PstS family phosphate ABC transporter substrate-binding protein n=1 Tax=Methanosarcina sp. MTP4 TaxID=1434100 RepID=UPI0006160B66|nr:PstS family phosphate ABC transporter substrate-binding protein [Methanosarcina sp. MTP4]AKB26059.1 Phosphate ABC transporter, periplasmic phosphate-binding protein PstS [Methanosarcina sp. MTP4]